MELLKSHGHFSLYYLVGFKKIFVCLQFICVGLFLILLNEQNNGCQLTGLKIINIFYLKENLGDL